MNTDLILREKLAIQRTHMANQTTFLAFVRTSLYFAVAGLSIENLLKLPHLKWIEYLMFGLSVLTFLYGLYNFVGQHRRIKNSQIHIGQYKIDHEGN